jgi:predicted AlkP superfamily pyrophosphatase or phosphodiesterase
MKRLLCTLAAVMATAVAATFTSCNKAEEGSRPMAKHVIWIGLDGWGAYSMDKAIMPVTKGFMQEGAYTLKKRSVLPSSSALNWASMFMGACPELHGYTTWGSKTPELPSRELNQHGTFPTVFQLYREANPEAEIGCVYDWSGIKYVIDTLAFNYWEQGPDYTKDSVSLKNMAVKYITEKKPNLFAVIFDNPDHVGHSAGHDTPGYYDKLKELDGYIGEIVEAVKQAGMMDETVFVITGDHGGIDRGHGGMTMMEMETPFIISGKPIKKGFCFDNVSMMQFDCASTLAKLLGLTQPQVWIGRPMPVFNE